MNNIIEQITLFLTVISFFIIGYLIYLSFDKDKRNRLESKNSPIKNSISFRLNIDKNEVDEFSLEEDEITIQNKNGFKMLIFRKTEESVLYFRSDRVDNVEILGVEDILKFSSEINSGKKSIEQRFWLDDDNFIARVENNVKDVKVTKSEKDNDNSDDDSGNGSGINDLMLATVNSTVSCCL